MARLEVALERLRLGLLERAEQVGADVVAAALVVARRHATSSGSPSTLPAQLLEPEPHPALDGADGQLEHLGDLGVGEAAEVGQLDHAPLLLGQRLERAAHGARLLAPGHLDVGALGRLEALLDALGARAAAVVDEVAPQRVDRAVVDDPEHPGAHAAARRLVAQRGCARSRGTPPG